MDLPEPIELARVLAVETEDFVFLDSAGHCHPKRDQSSWLFWGALRGECRGSIHQAQDRDVLRDLLLTQGQDLRPLVGGVDYNGQFHFAIFEFGVRWHHPSCEWQATQPRDQAELERLAKLSQELADSPSNSTLKSSPLIPQSSDEEYLAAIVRAQEYIAAGDIYQVNLSRVWGMNWPEKADPWRLYEAWRAHAKAPQSAFLRLERRTVLSASPETFLELDSERRISTHPIKGTIHASDDPAEDDALRCALSGSEKERAELLMITDLLRNDLGQIAATGSVRVPALHQMESFGHLHHLVSSVEAQLAPGLDALDLLAATHPGGSITGAPKKRAREIIEKLEPHQRGLYCGSIGWVRPDSLRLSLAIRTAVIESGQLRYQAGSGIVADSDPERELAETALKTEGFRSALERMS